MENGRHGNDAVGVQVSVGEGEMSESGVDLQHGGQVETTLSLKQVAIQGHFLKRRIELIMKSETQA